MEFLNMLVKALDGCVGLLEVLTVFFDIAALFVGVKTYKKQQHAAEKLAHQHANKPIKKPTWWPVVVLAVLGIVFTALTAWKYLYGVH
jgi:hypothetical protein